MTSVYRFSIQCQAVTKAGKPCNNKASWYYDSSYRCGVHSKVPGKGDTSAPRVELPENPDKEADKLKSITKHLDALDLNAQSKQGSGTVSMYRIQMRKEVPLVPGKLNIFPNRRHGNRLDGLGLPSMSPMNLGPVNHGQPGLPMSKCVENYHQSNKVFENEVTELGVPNELFFSKQVEMYTSDVPQRHKYTKKDRPLYSVHLTADGKLKRFDYVQSRYFYCE
jgi:hypothetical protein